MIMSINVNKSMAAGLILLLIITAAVVGNFFFRDDEKNDEAVIKESAYSFISEITNRDYRRMTGREGYGYFSEKLLEKAEKGSDAQKTNEKYRREQIVQKLAGEPECCIEMRGRDSADALIYYKEKINSRPYLRRIFAVLYYKREKDGKWKIENFQIERY